MNLNAKILRKRRGFTVTELLVAAGLSSLLLAGLASFSFFSGTSLIALTNYTEFTTEGRAFLDQFSRDIRQANRLDQVEEHSLSLKDANGNDLYYYYDPTEGILYRQQDGVDKALLKNCDRFSFSVFQRTPVEGSYEQFPVATPATAKVVQAHWNSKRSVFGVRESNQSTYSAKVVIRIG